ncbi:MAG: alpha/beta hydrolase [Desulfuromonadaceae bacterium]
MQKIAALLLLLLLCVPVIVQAADGYGYPIPGSYAATIMGTPQPLQLEKPKNISMKQLVLDIYPEKKKADIFFYDEGVVCNFAWQKKKAPLIFLIAGTGSSATSGKLISMTYDLYKAGYHVISIASPTHPNFIVSASKESVPGDLSIDAADIYNVMEKAWAQVKGDIEVSSFELSGYSLGGTQAAFVAKLDEERKTFNFKKVVLINPAVNLYYSVERIEALLDGIPGGPRKIGTFFNNTLEKFTEFYQAGDYIGIDNDFLYSVYKAGLVSHEEAGGLIALAFRIASAGMIFTSDVMTNGGYVVPKNRVLKYTDLYDDYFKVAIRLSFIDYFNEYFYPYMQKKQPGLTKDALIASLGLKNIESYLKGNPKFSAMTNENDFILDDADRAYLKDLFGARTKIYPRGGHLGNLEYRENMIDMTEILKILDEKGGVKP